MNKRFLIKRLIASPFIFGILLVTYLFGFFKAFIKVMKYGGEWLSYEKEDPKRMDSIYKLLKQDYNNKYVSPEKPKQP